MFDFDKKKNLVDSVPQDCGNHCSAGDIGVSAADTILSLGWNDGSTDVWVVDQEEERVNRCIRSAIHAQEKRGG